MGVALAASSAFAQTEIVTFTNPLSGGDLTITGSGSGVGGSIDFSGGILLDGSTHGDTAGLTGTITGTYSWTNAGITPEGGGTQAPLSGSGTISISDGAGHNLTGTVVSMEKIETNAAGDFMPVNDLLVLNLSGLSYSGTNADLLALRDSGCWQSRVGLYGQFGHHGKYLVQPANWNRDHCLYRRHQNRAAAGFGPAAGHRAPGLGPAGIPEEEESL